MRVLITGGAGFIGSHLTHLHLEKGDEVHVVDDLSTGRKANIASYFGNRRFSFDRGDILTWPGLFSAVSQCDRIYHLAAVVGVRHALKAPVRVVQTNIISTERLLRTIAESGESPEILITSSSEAYGLNPNEQFQETDSTNLLPRDQLRWCYALSKLTDEFMAKAYADQYRLRLTIARLFNTIGPRQVEHYGMVVPNFIKQAVFGKPITVYGDGSQTRSFCDVRDSVCALDRLASNPLAHGEIVNIGNDQEISIRDLAWLVRERTGGDSEIRFIPYSQAYGERFEDIPRRKPCLDKFKRLTHFNHRWTLTQTIDDLIARMRASTVSASFSLAFADTP